MNQNEIYIDMRIDIADSYFNRLKGLMFRRKPLRNNGLLLTPCGSIHMFFMRFPIDVIFIGEDSNVVDTFPNLQPWKVAIPKQKAFATFELPVGTITKYKVKIGDKITNKITKQKKHSTL